MSTNQITPGDWVVDERPDGLYISSIIEGECPEDTRAVEICKMYDNSDDDWADATHIVNMYNAFPALQEQNRELVEALRNVRNFFYFNLEHDPKEKHKRDYDRPSSLQIDEIETLISKYSK